MASLFAGRVPLIARHNVIVFQRRTCTRGYTSICKAGIPASRPPRWQMYGMKRDEGDLVDGARHSRLFSRSRDVCVSSPKTVNSKRDEPPPSRSQPTSTPYSTPATSPASPAPSAPAAPPHLTRILRENIYTLPNILTFSRLLSAPAIGYFILHDSHVLATSLFLYAGLTDLADGWIARRFNSHTVVGTVLDPMADKTLMTCLTVCLAMKGLMPVWLAGIILARDIGLGFAALYYRYISLPPPKTLARYWDFSLPSAEVHPTGISKVNTALQLVLIGACTVQPLLGDISLYMTYMQYIVATTTVWSGASYVYSKDAVKILGQEKK